MELKLNKMYQLGPDIVPWVVELVYIGNTLVVFKTKDGKEESRTLSFFIGFAKESLETSEQTVNPLTQLHEEIEKLKKELHQQKFNNKHNLSIDQSVSDKIKDLEGKREKLEFHLDAFGGWLIEKNCSTVVLDQFRRAREIK